MWDLEIYLSCSSYPRYFWSQDLGIEPEALFPKRMLVAENTGEQFNTSMKLNSSRLQKKSKVWVNSPLITTNEL